MSIPEFPYCEMEQEEAELAYREYQERMEYEAQAKAAYEQYLREQQELNEDSHD